MEAARVYAVTSQEPAAALAEAAYDKCGDLWGAALASAGRLIPVYQEEAKKQLVVEVLNTRAKAVTRPAPSPRANRQAY